MTAQAATIQETLKTDQVAFQEILSDAELAALVAKHGSFERTHKLIRGFMSTHFHLSLQPSLQAVERVFQQLVDMVAVMGLAATMLKIVDLNNQLAYVDTYGISLSTGTWPRMHSRTWHSAGLGSNAPKWGAHERTCLLAQICENGYAAILQKFRSLTRSGATMTRLQKLVLAILPKRWSAAIQAESESWLLQCSVCNTTRSVWELGGIRFKAASVGKSTMVWCAQCGQLRRMSVERSPSA